MTPRRLGRSLQGNLSSARHKLPIPFRDSTVNGHKVKSTGPESSLCCMSCALSFFCSTFPFLSYSAYKLGPHRIAVLGLGLTGRSIGSLEVGDESCSASVRLACAQGGANAGLEGKLTPVPLDVDKVLQQSHAVFFLSCWKVRNLTGTHWVVSFSHAAYLSPDPRRGAKLQLYSCTSAHCTPLQLYHAFSPSLFHASFPWCHCPLLVSSPCNSAEPFCSATSPVREPKTRQRGSSGGK